jgi:predicted transcriptional regulator
MLKNHLKSLPSEERGKLAKSIGVSAEFLRLVAGGHKQTSIEVALKAEELTGVKGAGELLSESNRKLLARLRRQK